MSEIERHGAISVLRPDRPLRQDEVSDLDDKIRPSITRGVPLLVIDLTDTPLIDSAGLEWMLDLDEQCCGRGGCLRLCNVGELCVDLLRITGVGSVIQQYADLESALASFA